MWLENALAPSLAPLAASLVPNGEIHQIVPESDGLKVAVEDADGKLHHYVLHLPSAGWEAARQIAE